MKHPIQLVATPAELRTAAVVIRKMAVAAYERHSLYPWWKRPFITFPFAEWANLANVLDDIASRREEMP